MPTPGSNHSFRFFARTSVATVKPLCFAISSPRSHVSERRSVAGSWQSANDVLPGLQCSCSWRRSADRLPNGQESLGLPLPAAFRGWRWRRRSDRVTVRSPCDVASGACAGSTADGPAALFSKLPRLNEETTVNGFVRHAHALVIGIVHVQPSGNLLGRPVQDQFTRNDSPQLAVES
jgi:hypothetical protein